MCSFNFGFLVATDSDMNLMFGDCYRRLSQSENSGPDLAGIRQMLDLVSAFEHIIYRFIYFILGAKPTANTKLTQQKAAT